MNILSCFDGMSCGQIALNQLGIRVDNYYASEIDKYAIQIAQKNYPDTIQLGNIENWWSWELPKIDLLLGGSPCQGFSFAGKQLNFDDPRSKLFFEYVGILKELKPKYFLMENVRMKKEYQAIISEHLGVEPIMINSSLVSAQNRVRLYWTNIPNIDQPKDKGLVLKDILEDSVDSKYNYSDKVLSRLDVSEIRHVGKCGYKTKGKECDKSPTLLARHYKGMQSMDYPIVRNNYIEVPEATKKGYVRAKEGEGLDLTFPTSKTRRGRLMKEKCNCLTATNYEYGVVEKELTWRKLTPLECERLQTVPDNYTNFVSNSQRYKMLGNGWTIEVIKHILKNILDT